MKMQMKPKTIALFAVAAIFLIVLLQNMDAVPFLFLFWSVHVPKLILVLGSILIGWVSGWLTHLAYNKGKSKNAKSNGSAMESHMAQGSEQAEAQKEDQPQEQTRAQS